MRQTQVLLRAFELQCGGSFPFWAKRPLAAVACTSILYRNATIISFSSVLDTVEVLRNADVLIQGTHIEGVYTAGTAYDTREQTTIIDATDKIISPGFVDTHHHLWQTAFKTLASKTTLLECFERYGQFGPANEYFTPEDNYLGQLAGCLELLYSGTTSVVDHAHGAFSDEASDATVNATFDCGARVRYAFAIESKPSGYGWDQQIAKLQQYATEPGFTKGSLVSLSLALDNFASAPAANTTAIWSLVQTLHLSLVTTHYVGSPWNFNNSPTLLASSNILNTSTPIIFSHASFLTPKDVAHLRTSNQYIATTPESEFHHGHINPAARTIQDQTSLGLDAHFTSSTSTIQQARLWLQSPRHQNYTDVLARDQLPINNPMSVRQALPLITRAGGVALRRDDVGVLRAGAKADLVVFRTDALNMLGWKDAIAAVVLHLDVGDIEDVLVGGEFVEKGGRLVFPEGVDVSRRFRGSAERIQGIWEGVEWAGSEGGGGC